LSINNFDVLKEMGKRNLDIRLTPLGNIGNMRKVKAGTDVTIGVAGDVIAELLSEKFVGGLIMADKVQFDQVKAEMEKAETDGE
jgi:hypothetical protein